MITSLALNDLAIGLLITPFGTLPALLHCWPYGEIFCQIQVSCCTNLFRMPCADANLHTFSELMIIALATIFSHMISFLLQALLRGALTQQSAVILVCMAVDRYTCALYPHKYHQHSSKKVSLFFI